MKYFLIMAALFITMSSEAMAQRCGSMKGTACVTCCQGTGRSQSECQNYCAKGMPEKKVEASRDSKRKQCLAQAGITQSESAGVGRRDPRYAVYHSCMGR